MDATTILGLKVDLQKYLEQFQECFTRQDTRAHLDKYVGGQLSDLQRKNVEAIALDAGVPVRTLQEFLSQHKWDEDAMRNVVHEIVANEHVHPNSIGIIDETSAVKKGDKTPGVQRQHLGCVGKQDNGIVTVHLAYAADDFQCLLDGELFLPESWSKDRARCEEAGIPENMVYRPKSEIALELYDRARTNGVQFEWLTFDEWYGVKPKFLLALDSQQQKFVGEVHGRFVAWSGKPSVTKKPWRKGGKGRGRKTPRLKAEARKGSYVQDLFRHSPAFHRQRWERYYVKDGEKGPLVWEAKRITIHVKDEDGLPTGPWHLIVCRNVTNPDELKFFISNASPKTSLEELMLVAFSRWRVERCFQDQKGEVGLDHYEGRRYKGLKRHLILSCVSYLFLSQVRERLRGKKPGVDRVPSSDCCVGIDRVMLARGRVIKEAVGSSSREDRLSPKTQRTSSQEPHENRQTQAGSPRCRSHPNPKMRVARKTELAL